MNFYFIKRIPLTYRFNEIIKFFFFLMISNCIPRRKSKLINRRIGDTVWISYGLLYLFLTFKFVSLRSFFRDSDEKSKNEHADRSEVQS